MLRIFRSVGDFAWEAILTGSLDEETEDAWRLMFNKPTFIDHRDFSVVHKIILGLTSIDLEAYLKLSTSTINDQDSGGRTPLSWAVSKGDSHLVQILLQYGADTGIVDNFKASPLHHAARASNPTCLRLLLDYGANVNAKNYRGRSPLHFASAYNDGARYLEPLIKAGADVNATESSEKETPIIWACERDNAQNVAFLLKCGAALDIQGSIRTPLQAAVISKAYQTLKILLREGPNYARTYTNGETILHIAASNADEKILQILAEGAPFPGLDPEQKNHCGDTALDVLSKRFEFTPSLSDSFQRLLRLIRADRCD